MSSGYVGCHNLGAVCLKLAESRFSIQYMETEAGILSEQNWYFNNK